MYRYYNIHTHQTGSQADSLSVVNLYDNFADAAIHKACSTGLHPWYLQDADESVKQLKEIAALPQVIAIGECGLDKVCATDWKLQLSIFSKQIALAADLHKPLIIHCVRAWEEVLAMLQQNKPRVPVIFHGFNKGNMATRLTDLGYYLSFGKALMNTDSPAVAALKQIPPTRFFLETDDAGIPISDIYQKAATLLQTEEDDVILQLQQNFKNVFGK